MKAPNDSQSEDATFSAAGKRKLNEIFQDAVPRSYNSFPKRYARAVTVLLCVRNDEDAPIFESENKVCGYFKYVASTDTAKVTPLKKLIAKGVEIKRSAAARANAVAAISSRRRDGKGKFLKKDLQHQKASGSPSRKAKVRNERAARAHTASNSGENSLILAQILAHGRGGFRVRNSVEERIFAVFVQNFLHKTCTTDATDFRSASGRFFIAKRPAGR
jgi:hypothetical protein